MNVKRCRYCKATILRTETTRGKPISLDPGPHVDGSVVLSAGGAMILSGEQVEIGRRLGTKRYKPHLETCRRGKRQRFDDRRRS
jgi:hypothetical protein